MCCDTCLSLQIENTWVDGAQPKTVSIKIERLVGNQFGSSKVALAKCPVIYDRVTLYAMCTKAK